MTAPTGKITSRPMLPRACGCLQEFQIYEVDRYRVQRQKKFQSTRCAACAAKHNEEQRKLEIPKGEAFSQLPGGTQITLTRGENGTWTGTLSAAGSTVSAEGEGPQAVSVKLARNWLRANRANSD